MDRSEVDFRAYKAYVELWASENPIKTNKLQVLLVVNGLLVSALQLGNGAMAGKWPIFLAGAVLSVIWVMSIGRTSLFQKVWQYKARQIAMHYPNDPRFQVFDTDEAKTSAPPWLRALGGISSKYYLLGAPVLFSVMWAIGLVCVLVAE